MPVRRTFSSILSVLFTYACGLMTYLAFSCARFLPYDKLGLGFSSLSAIASVSKPGISDQRTSAKNPHSPSIALGPVLYSRHSSIHAAFSHYAKMHPETLAVKSVNAVITYRQLDHLSSIVAAYLCSLNVGRGQRVLLLVSRSITMVVGIFGILKAGASYIPLDGGIVTDVALETILEDARPAVVLCLGNFSSRARGMGVPVVDIEEFLLRTDCDGVYVGDESEGKNGDTTEPSDEAYVIYTSGTTGRPKGVSVSHRNVTNLILSSPGNLSICPGTRVSQLLNVAFDMAAWEILGCLCNGGTLVLRPSGQNCSSWTSILNEIDVVIATPSILAQFSAKNFRNIKIVATAGERCPQKLADEWAAERSFWNCCGPTETTIINTAHLHVPGRPNMIGRPTPNNAVYVLDDGLRPVPVGAPGVLWAGGAGVCKGYVNLPELTKERFLPDPFSPGSVMYNTGDIGRLRPDGEIDHLGRADDQVKIKGFRVELDGVAAAVSSCPGISSSAVVLIDQSLSAFYSPASIPADKVRDAVERIQPYYARPVRYIGMDAMPLTSNGKLDKAILKEQAKKLKSDI